MSRLMTMGLMDLTPDDSPTATWTTRDQDGVDSLRDTQEESGDEEAVGDVYSLDHREAREAGVELDDTDDESRLE
jgi:hypothetical protein